MKNIKLLTLLSLLAFTLACGNKPAANNTDPAEQNNNNNNNDDLAAIKAVAQTNLDLAQKKVLDRFSADLLDVFRDKRNDDVKNITKLANQLDGLLRNTASTKTKIKTKSDELGNALRDAESLNSIIASYLTFSREVVIYRNKTDQNCSNYVEINNAQKKAKDLDLLVDVATIALADFITKRDELEKAIIAVPACIAPATAAGGELAAATLKLNKDQVRLFIETTNKAYFDEQMTAANEKIVDLKKRNQLNDAKDAKTLKELVEKAIETKQDILDNLLEKATDVAAVENLRKLYTDSIVAVTNKF